MSPLHHSGMEISSASSTVILVALVFVSLIYMRGWRRMRGGLRALFWPGARLVSFLECLWCGER
jgi:hypothetical protein